MQFLGLPAALSERLDPRTTTANLLPMKAPLDGVVVAREVVAGEGVDVARALFVVADTSKVWLTLSVRLEDAGHLALGQPVRFRPDGESAEVAGTVSWISTAVDEKTRTLKVRADLPNPDGRLRAHAFGLGRIVLREEKNAVVVPTEAVQWEGDCYVVFVRDKNYLDEKAPKVFHVRQVRPGARDERHTEILAGVLPGELVVSQGVRRPGGGTAQGQARRGLRLRPLAARSGCPQPHDGRCSQEETCAQRHHRLFAAAPPAGHRGHAGLRGRGRVRAGPPRHRRLPRHDAGAGADQHRRPVPGAGGGRAADHLSHRAGASAACPACSNCARCPSSACPRWW